MERRGGASIADRLLDYSVRIVRLTDAMPNSIAGRHIGDQLLRSGTSVGANYQEAQAAVSDSDFIHKLQISLKELRETRYWLRLIIKAGIIKEKRLTGLLDETAQLLAILSKAIITKKKTWPRSQHAKTKNNRQRPDTAADAQILLTFNF